MYISVHSLNKILPSLIIYLKRALVRKTNAKHDRANMRMQKPRRKPNNGEIIFLPSLNNCFISPFFSYNYYCYDFTPVV